MSIRRRPSSFLSAIVATAASALLAADAVAQHAHAAGALGRVVFPVSCPTSQDAFNHAAALLHHMTYPQAREAFAQISAADPGCAMAHWGYAMTLFQPLWPTRPGLEARRRGWDEVQEAKALQPPTDRERLFIAAAEAFFVEPESNDYWLRIRRWEAAQQKVYDAYPDDPEAAAFYALAHLATAPSNRISREHADRAAAILLRIYRQNPDHPGAMHYLVHANDVPGRERELLEITRKYESVAPNNPHALHMPTHIYTRLGDWDAVIRGNIRAAEAALQQPAGEHGEFVWDEFPHAIEYLVYAYLQKGMDAEAAAQMKRFHETPNVEPTFKNAFHYASTQARYALERKSWSDAAALVPREPSTIEWDKYAWPEAIVQFAHGLGSARTGKLDAATQAIARLEQLETRTARSGEELFARNIRVLRLELSAWVAHAEGRETTAAGLMRAAADVEDTTPKHAVTPAPTLPAHEQLGDLLMEQGRPAAALREYRDSLTRYPHRFNSILGGARAARASGDERAARALYRELLKLATNEREAMQEARANTR